MKNFEMKQITYLSEQVTDYQRALDQVETLWDLLCLLKNYETIAWDALDLAKQFSEKRFDEFLRGLKKERRGIFSKNEDVAVILIPAIMIKVSMIAQRFCVPWGCAFIRLTDVGKLKHTSGRYYFVEEPSHAA